MIETTQKIFGIGFHKTGTTSLRRALEALGYRVTGPNGVRDPEIATHARKLVLELAEQFDAFQDNPWPLFYRELDQHYPGSKFILTKRPPERWIASVVRHFGTDSTPMRELIYGAGRGHPAGNEDHYLEVYNRHNAEVMEYFRDRPDDLLVLEFEKGDGWDKLCPFLNLAIPSMPFPQAGTANDREERLSRFSTTRLVKRLILGPRGNSGQ